MIVPDILLNYIRGNTYIGIEPIPLTLFSSSVLLHTGEICCVAFTDINWYATISNVRQVPLLLVEQDTQTGNLNTNVRNVLGQWMNIILALRNGIVQVESVAEL